MSNKPIMGVDSEWCDVGKEMNDSDSYQNNRCSAVFKQGKNGRSYYLDAIVWQGEDDWDTFTGTMDGISSRQYIKSFPFTPKTFRIHVKRERFDPTNENHKKSQDVVSCGDGDYVYIIKDKTELEKVFEYYDKYENTLKAE